MRLTLLSLLFLGFSFGQTCDFSFTFRSGDSPKQFNNKGKACYNWQVTYFASGLSAVTMQFESAPDAGSIPGAFVAFAGTLLTGSNPMTSLVQATSTFQGSYAWVRINPTLTGSGTVTGRVMGSPLTTAQFPSPFSVSNPCVAMGQRTCTPPDTTLFSWRRSVAMAATTETVTNGIPFLDTPPGPGDQEFAGREIIPPAPPFTIRAIFMFLNENRTNVSFPQCGIYFADNGTGRMSTIGHYTSHGGNPGVLTYQHGTWNSTSSKASSGTLYSTDISSNKLVAFSMVDDGVSHIYRHSIDGLPAHEKQIHTEPRATWLAATNRAGYFCAGGSGMMLIYGWEVTVP